MKAINNKKSPTTAMAYEHNYSHKYTQNVNEVISVKM